MCVTGGSHSGRLASRQRTSATEIPIARASSWTLNNSSRGMSGEEEARAGMISLRRRSGTDDGPMLALSCSHLLLNALRFPRRRIAHDEVPTATIEKRRRKCIRTISEIALQGAHRSTSRGREVRERHHITSIVGHLRGLVIRWKRRVGPASASYLSTYYGRTYGASCQENSHFGACWRTVSIRLIVERTVAILPNHSEPQHAQAYSEAGSSSATSSGGRNPDPSSEGSYSDSSRSSRRHRRPGSSPA